MAKRFSKSATANYDQRSWYEQYARWNPKNNINALIKRRDYDAVLTNFVQHNDFVFLEKRAYKSPRGFAVGYVNGNKVMYVSGSRNVTDWVLNVMDDFIPASKHHLSNRTAKNLTKIALDQNIDVTVGHSRGGMLVAKMDIPDDKKLAVDGALRLAPRDKADIMNLYQNQILDKFIAARGTNKKKYPLHSYYKYHFISRDWPGYDPDYVQRAVPREPTSRKRRKLSRY